MPAPAAAAGAAAAGGGAAGGISAGQMWAMIGAGMLGSSALGAISTKKQMHYASDLMHLQQSWAERMSNTAHQREVTDLKAAGLNPILSATGGQGASTPSAGMGQVNAPDYGSIPEAIAAATQVKQADAQTRLMDQQALTEETKRDNFEANTALQHLQAIGENIKNMNLPEIYKREIEETISRTVLNYTTGSVKQLDAVSNRIKAEADKQNAESNRMVAKEQAKYTKERNRGGGIIESVFEGVKNSANDRGWKTNRNPIIHR